VRKQRGETVYFLLISQKGLWQPESDDIFLDDFCGNQMFSAENTLKIHQKQQAAIASLN